MGRGQPTYIRRYQAKRSASRSSPWAGYPAGAADTAPSLQSHTQRFIQLTYVYVI